VPAGVIDETVFRHKEEVVDSLVYAWGTKIILLPFFAALCVVQAWRTYKKHDRSSISGWRKPVVQAGLRVATANVAICTSLIFYSWSPPPSLRVRQTILMLSLFLSFPGMIVIAAGNGKSGKFALPSMIFLLPVWLILGLLAVG